MFNVLNTSLRYTFGTVVKLTNALIRYPFSKRYREALSSAYSTLDYPFYGARHVDISYILKNDSLEVKIAPFKSNQHNVSEFELSAICALIKDRGVKNIFEIGTYDGRTTRAMAMNISEGGTVYTLNLSSQTKASVLNTSSVDIDLSSKVISGYRFHSSVEEKNIIQLWGDSASFDFFPYSNIIDLVFIDGAHSVEYVENDTLKAINMLNPNDGFIIWHDAHLFGVRKCIQHYIDKNKWPIYFIKDTSLALAFFKNHSCIDIN